MNSQRAAYLDLNCPDVDHFPNETTKSMSPGRFVYTCPSCERKTEYNVLPPRP